ncbi:MAG: DUF4214 domain-containing protein [Clostridia bacterium]|nr:DUF4214 domain-containing protein [Clostridia bacterium]
MAKKLTCLFIVLITAIGIMPFLFASDVCASGEEDYWRSYGNSFYYDQLTEESKELYDIIDTELIKPLLSSDDFSEITVDISSVNMKANQTNRARLRNIALLVLNSNPEYFYFNSIITTYPEPKLKTDVKYETITFNIWPDFQKGSDREKAKDEIKTVVEEYISCIPSGARPEEAEKIIHDRMCDKITYGTYISDLGSELDQTIYSASKGLTVCNGYAHLFMSVMNRLGIRCVYVRSETHAWNAVCLYGYWYIVDVTHDDSIYVEGTIYYFYNTNKNRKGVPGKSVYTPLGPFKQYAPDIKYDELEEGSGYSYIPRYFEVDGNEFFVISDTDTEDGRLVLLLDQKSAVSDTVEYMGQQYKITTNSYSVTLDPTVTPSLEKDEEKGFADFVERLYTVALGRASEPEGKAFWCEHVGNGDLNGAECANEFLLSKEFNDRKLSDEDFLKVLYKTFFDRDAANDPDGFNFWMNSLKTEGRDKVVDGFINSTEWCNICASHGVKSGATRAKATIASKNATAFATRLYTECLGRDPETDGLNFWSLGLTNLELTGSEAAHEFFFSKEFNDHNFDNKELLTRMYRTFMGREPDDDGMNFWLNNMKNGMTKEDVFNEFVKSAEFTQICKDYAIDRG